MENMMRVYMASIRKTAMAVLFALIGVNSVSAQDLLVTNKGESLTVYNLEIGSTAIFYQLSTDANADIKRIAKTDVLIIRKADGTKIDPNAAAEPVAEVKTKPASSRALVYHPKREVVTVTPSSAIETDKKGVRKFSANTPGGHLMNFQILSGEEHTLTLLEGDYNDENGTYVIPDYVTIGGQQYAVTEIAESAFRKSKAQYVTFPSTLKKIGNGAFMFSNLKSIILPDGIEELGKAVFMRVRSKGFGGEPVDEIYLPESLKVIGSTCFWCCGSASSYRGYTQAFFSCMPVFITEGNCKDFGIDEEAVKAYNQALRDKR